MSKLICREPEIEILNRLATSKQAEFLAIYGRRRIGKTYLIHQFFKGKGLYFELTGAKNAPKAQQLRHFSKEFSACFLAGRKTAVPGDWSEAFFELKTQVENQDPSQRVILFFDEIPWLASKKSGFLEALEHAWNRYFSRMDHVVLIVCGSAASWMIQKILSNKGGLYGRLTAQIRLLPFTLLETERYLQSQGVLLDRKQLVELYMALGGVAKYLSYVKSGQSAAQNISEICFSPQGALHHEFFQLYQSLFDHPEQHIKIIRALSQRWSGLSVSELQQETGNTSGGFFSNLLRELEESGFILQIPDFGKKKKDARYRLIDEFSLFYLRFMEEAQTLKSLQKDYWLRAQMSPSYLTWAGYAFEGIGLKHLQAIIEALGLSVVAAHSSGWFSKEAQIDLLIDRADACMNLCEIKFYRQKWAMTSQDAAVLNHRKELFRAASKTKKTLFTTLITPYGAEQNQHYFSSVQQQLKLEDLFR